MWSIHETPDGDVFTHEHHHPLLPSLRDAPLRARIHGAKPTVDHEKVRTIVAKQREIERLRDEQDILIYEVVASGVSAWNLHRFTRIPQVGARAARGAELLNEVLHLTDPEDEQSVA